MRDLFYIFTVKSTFIIDNLYLIHIAIAYLNKAAVCGRKVSN